MTLKTNTTFKTLPAIYDEGIAIHVNIKNSQDSVESCEFFMYDYVLTLLGFIVLTEVSLKV